MKKKTLTLFLVGVLTLAVSACGASGTTNDNVDETEASVTVGSASEATAEASEEESASAIEAETSDGESAGIINFDDVILVDNEAVTIKLVNFYEEEVNWSEGAQLEKYITVKATNNTDHEILLNPGKFYIDDEEAYVVMKSGTIAPDPGKSGSYSFMVAYNTTPEHTALESLDELYTLEGSFSGLHKYDDSSKNTSLEVGFSIPNSLNAESAVAEAAEANKGFENVISALNGNTWYFNGGSDTILNSISFSDTEATIAQVYYDGNGKHDNGSNSMTYIVDDTAVHVTTADGGTLDIPYSLNGDTVALGENDFLTIEQIDEGLQGYWTCESKSSFGNSKFNIYIGDGIMISESASEAIGGSNGEYYYYGPSGDSSYKGTYYKLEFGGFDTDMRKGSNWFFNIIDGKPTVLHYDTVCTPSDGLPGENGYSF